MFELLKKRRIKQSLRDGPLAPLGKMMNQMALAVAVSEIAAEYFKSQSIIPICTDPKASLVDIWIGTRLEAISKLWNFGSASLALVIEPTKHPKLINAFIECSTKLLGYREPCGVEMEDSISAMLRVYIYLSELEQKVGVPQVRTIESVESNPSYATYGSLVTEMRKCMSSGRALDWHYRQNPTYLFNPKPSSRLCGGM